MSKIKKQGPRIFPKGKGGWIRVVEAFVAVLLIAGAVLVLLGEGNIQEEDSNERIYGFENDFLRDVQLNDSLREEVLSAINLPVDWNEFNSEAPLIYNWLQLRIPAYLECNLQICELNNDCLLGKTIRQSVYARSVAITKENDNRKLKLFCWEK